MNFYDPTLNSIFKDTSQDQEKRTCELCNKTYTLATYRNEVNSHTIRYLKNPKQILTRCLYCFMQDMNTCNCCGKSYIGKPLDYTQSSLISRCNECEFITYKLLGYNGANAIKDLKLAITYTVCEETHDGYCSDPCSEEVLEYDMVYEYPLMPDINEEHISNFMKDPKSLEKNPINYYIMTQAQCNRGSGYCGMSNYYKVKDIRIIKSDNPYGFLGIIN